MGIKYGQFLSRSNLRWGSKFSATDLDPRFIKYYESGERIKVLDCDMEITGTVGVTTGWRPCFFTDADLQINR